MKTFINHKIIKIIETKVLKNINNHNLYSIIKMKTSNKIKLKKKRVKFRDGRKCLSSKKKKVNYMTN